MELYYKGSIRRLSGYGMAYANFDKAVGEDKIGQKETTAVPDSHLIVHSMNEEGRAFQSSVRSLQYSARSDWSGQLQGLRYAAPLLQAHFRCLGRRVCSCHAGKRLR